MALGAPSVMTSGTTETCQCGVQTARILPITGMGRWRYVSMTLGVPSVMTSGTTEMPVWCADSWDTPHMVMYWNWNQHMSACGLEH